MRKALPILILAPVLLFALSAMAQNKVVIVPLNSSNSVNKLFGQVCPPPKVMVGIHSSGNIMCHNENEKIVFVTSTAYTGNLGGITGANARCMTAASNAGLYGEFKAWLSSIGDCPKVSYTKSAVPYVRVDGAQVASNYTDLTDGTIGATISIDEFGNDVSAVAPEFSWTNTWTTGCSLASPHYDSCGEWLSDTSAGRVGNINKTDSNWSATIFSLPSTVPADCSLKMRLYCFEQ